MATRILPVRANTDGSAQFHIVHTKDPLRYGLTTLAGNTEIGSKQIIESLPDNLVYGDPGKLNIVRVPVAHGEDRYVFVVGDQSVFSTEAAHEGSRWASLNDLKQGPVPQGVANAGVLRHLYAESLDFQDLTALYTAASVAIAVRSGTTIPEGTWALLSAALRHRAA